MTNNRKARSFSFFIQRNWIARYTWAIALLLVFWYILSLFFEPYIIPNPFDVLVYFFNLIQTKIFWEHAFASFWRVSVALLVAFFVAFPLGIFLGYKKKFDAYISPLIFLTYPVPKIIFLPVFLMLFGLGDFARILLIALTVGYQILVVTRSAILGLDQKYIDAFKSLLPLNPRFDNSKDIKEIKSYREKHYRTQKLYHLLIPAALPDAIMSLKVASGTSIAILFMVESFANRRGFGFYIMDAFGRNDTLIMFSGIIAMSIMGIILYEFCNFLERRFCNWKYKNKFL